MVLTGSDGKRKRVLLVDDAADLLEVYQLALENEGYEVRNASSGEEALALAHAWRPDLIITDIFMPGMNGFELITHIRSDFAPPVPRVVAVSGFPDARDEALHRGATHFEVKPLSLDGLIDLVVLGLSEVKPRRAPYEANEREDRRVAARAGGQALLDVLLERSPAALAGMQRGAHALSRFFGHSTALVFLLRDGGLSVAATSNPDAYPLGAEATDLLELANDVLDSASTIVLSNLDAQTLLRRSSDKVRFFVGVPYIIDGRSVGAMCLVDDAPHDFASSELAVLEYTAARLSARFAGTRVQPIVGSSGLPSRAAFMALLAYTLLWAAENQQAVGVELLTSVVPPADGSCVTVFESLPAPRMLIALLDPHRIVIFCAGATVDVVRERLAVVRSTLGKSVELGASAEVMFEAPLPYIAPALILTWAEDALGRAVATGKRSLGVSLRWTKSGYV